MAVISAPKSSSEGKYSIVHAFLRNIYPKKAQKIASQAQNQPVGLIATVRKWTSLRMKS
jgi:hypothetical protein